jgi:hypothetical protein
MPPPVQATQDQQDQQRDPHVLVKQKQRIGQAAVEVGLDHQDAGRDHGDHQDRHRPVKQPRRTSVLKVGPGHAPLRFITVN